MLVKKSIDSRFKAMLRKNMTVSDLPLDATLEVMATACLKAGRFILDHYKKPLQISQKTDHSPVTLADQGAEAIILNHLRTAFPAIPVIAEEEVACGLVSRLEKQFFLVDPLDGTREFIGQNGEFTVNIALIDQCCPKLGVIFIPAQQKLYVGSPKGAFLYDAQNGEMQSAMPIKTRPLAKEPVAVMSRSHRCKMTDDWLDDHQITSRIAAGSSLKFCLLAQGAADIYPRFEPCMTWDVAAGDAILRAAGGIMVDEMGKTMLYNKDGVASEPCHKQGIFFAAGDPEFLAKLAI